MLIACLLVMSFFEVFTMTSFTVFNDCIVATYLLRKNVIL